MWNNSLLQSISIAVLLQVEISLGEADKEEDEDDNGEEKSETHAVLRYTEHLQNWSLTSRIFRITDRDVQYII